MPNAQSRTASLGIRLLSRYMVTTIAPPGGCCPSPVTPSGCAASALLAAARRVYDRCRPRPSGRRGGEEESMTLSDELAYTSLADLALRIRARQLSPVEVVDATIARIEARNPSITAFVYYGFDDARKAAKEAERAVMKGD